jgi:hypothetical protein
VVYFSYLRAVPAFESSVVSALDFVQDGAWAGAPQLGAQRELSEVERSVSFLGLPVVPGIMGVGKVLDADALLDQAGRRGEFRYFTFDGSCASATAGRQSGQGD